MANVKDKELQEAIKTFKRARELYYDNKFNEAEELMSGGESPLHLVFTAQMCAQKAGITFERDEIMDAVEKIGSAQTMLESHRREESVTTNLMNLLFARDLDQFEEAELHCEAAWAQMALVKAVMDFIEGENILCFIKGTLGIKNAYQLYHELYDYMVKRQGLAEQGVQPALDKHFESMVSFGYGTFTLYLSLMPQKVLNMLDIFGVHGSKTVGLEILRKGEEVDGVFSEINGLILLHYNLMICPYARIELEEELVDSMMAKYCGKWPNSVIFNLLRGKREMINRNAKIANAIYAGALLVDSDWEFFKNTLYLELTWSNMVMGEWAEAEKYSTIQFENSNRSKTFFSFLQLINHYRAKPNDSEKLIAYAEEIPKHQMTVAGKHLHAEKYAIRKARSFLKNKNFLFLPHYEMMYMFGLTDFADNKRLAVIKKEVEAALDDVANKKPYYHQHVTDDWFLGQLLLANIARIEGNYEKSREILELALQSEDSLEVDEHYAPWAHYEVAWYYFSVNNTRRARAHLACAKEYSSKVKSYTMEENLQFKVHMLNEMTEMKDSDRKGRTTVVFISESETSSSSYWTPEGPISNLSCLGEHSPKHKDYEITKPRPKSGPTPGMMSSEPGETLGVRLRHESYEKNVDIATKRHITELERELREKEEKEEQNRLERDRERRESEMSAELKQLDKERVKLEHDGEMLSKARVEAVNVTQLNPSDGPLITEPRTSIFAVLLDEDSDNNEVKGVDSIVETPISEGYRRFSPALTTPSPIAIPENHITVARSSVRLFNSDLDLVKDDSTNNDTPSPLPEQSRYNIKQLIRRFESMDEDPPVESPVDEVDVIFRQYEERRRQRDDEVEHDGKDIEVDGWFRTSPPPRVDQGFGSTDGSDPFNQTYHETPEEFKAKSVWSVRSTRSSVRLINTDFDSVKGGSNVSSYNLDNDNYHSLDGLEDDSPSDDEEGGSGVRYACVPKGFMKGCCGNTPEGSPPKEFGGEGSGKNETPLEKRLIKERGVQYVGSKSTVTIVKHNPGYEEFRKEEEKLKEAHDEKNNLPVEMVGTTSDHNHIGEVSD